MMAVFVSRWGERVRVQARTHRAIIYPFFKRAIQNDFSRNGEK